MHGGIHVSSNSCIHKAWERCKKAAEDCQDLPFPDQEKAITEQDLLANSLRVIQQL